MHKPLIYRVLPLILFTALCVSCVQGVAVSAKVPKTSVAVSKRNKKAASLKIKKVKKATGYQIYIAGSKKGKYKQTGATRTTSFQVLNLKSAKAYYVKVRAYKTSGNRIITGSFSKAIKIDKYVKETTASKYAKKVLDLVNTERTKRGLDALKLNSQLNKAAATRAKELVSGFSHTRPDGRDCFTILTDLEMIYSSVGENIAAGQASPGAVMESWMGSEGHRANILSGTYTSMGVGYYKASDSNKYYWVQIFIKE